MCMGDIPKNFHVNCLAPEFKNASECVGIVIASMSCPLEPGLDLRSADVLFLYSVACKFVLIGSMSAFEPSSLG